MRNILIHILVGQVLYSHFVYTHYAGFEGIITATFYGLASE